ncbi:lipopolysaccharide transport periplasmic protein LptA [Sulfuriferula sp. AH1]|uniref:lipopolysaccharide transport periplasmic protein LptA n=1 Tax=Sulfuriferula sp. AH1 TaxID=1985873 RepID=UPI000B3BA08E|nr:lipopolysaccharide transport periplasmic protein LptA [Sulfuriferula sp. AH1]ARU32564.1 lipopolysaccharide transport periplasmic protein LptA [Sulfuriferula sp. AH1]
MNLFNKSIIIGACLFSLSAPFALAEQADRTKPVNLEADSVTVDDLHKVSIYVGNVILLQGTMTLKADRIEVHQDGEGFNKATAFGNPVYFRQKQDNSDEYIEGYASRLDMDTKQNTVLLTGNARLKKGADELRGNTMSYNTATEYFEVKNDPNVAKSPGVSPSRVHAVIRPKPKAGAQPPATPLPLQPAGSLNPDASK